MKAWPVLRRGQAGILPQGKAAGCRGQSQGRGAREAQVQTPPLPQTELEVCASVLGRRPDRLCQDGQGPKESLLVLSTRLQLLTSLQALLLTTIR